LGKRSKEAKMATTYDDVLISAIEFAKAVEAFGLVGFDAEKGLLRAVYTQPWRHAMEMVQDRMQAIGLVTWFDTCPIHPDRLPVGLKNQCADGHMRAAIESPCRLAPPQPLLSHR
jgi:hypothetical protein